MVGQKNKEMTAALGCRPGPAKEAALIITEVITQTFPNGAVTLGLQQPGTALRVHSDHSFASASRSLRHYLAVFSHRPPLEKFLAH